MPKMRMGTPAAPTVRTKRYSAFKGVDFSADPSQVDDSRSPNAVNIIADAAGCPQKRPGWRKLSRVEAPVRGIYRFETTVESQENEDGETSAVQVKEFIVHAGAKLYRWQGGEDAPVQLLDGLTGEYSNGFMHKDCMYILTGEEYVYVKAELAIGAAEAVVSTGNVADSDAAYIPLRRINSNVYYSTPSEYRDGYNYGTVPDVSGEIFEELNMATNYRKNSFLFNNEDFNYESEMFVRVDEKIVAGTPIGDIELITEQGNVLKGNELAGDPENIYYRYGRVIYFTEFTHGLISHGGGFNQSDVTQSPGNECLYINNRLRLWLDAHGDTSTSFTIRFPAASPVVELATDEKKEYEDYYDRIRKCRTFSWYNSRLFVTGNPDYPNADWYSEVGEPTYFKEINYTEIGNDDSRILGYLPVGEQQAVIKSDSIQLQDAAIYLRSSAWDDEIGYYFPVKKGVTGTGAVGFGSFGTLVDDSMYISADGVMGVITENITGERVLHGRSTRINNRLLKESGLENAMCCVWNGYLLIAVNGKIYVADSRQKTYARNVAGNFEYEWYYWEGIPAVCFKTRGSELFFGTADGGLCKLNTDLYDEDGQVSLKTYSDWHDGLSGEPTAIVAQWATKFDDDGDFMVKKNMTRRGCGVFLKGTRRGNVKIYIRTDKTLEDGILAANRKRGVFSWDDIDFNNFTFETMPRLVAAVNKKIKKYSAIQVIVRSDEPNNDFGVLGIERRFVSGYYEK